MRARLNLFRAQKFFVPQNTQYNGSLLVPQEFQVPVRPASVGKTRHNLNNLCTNSVLRVVLEKKRAPVSVGLKGRWS